MEYYLITFSNTHSAIAAQKSLQGKLPFVVMPTLREISNSCGISLKIESVDYQEIKSQMELYFHQSTMYKIYQIMIDESGKINSMKLL